MEYAQKLVIKMLGNGSRRSSQHRAQQRHLPNFATESPDGERQQHFSV